MRTHHSVESCGVTIHHDSMRFTEDSTANVHVIRGYDTSGIRINNDVFDGAVMVSATELRREAIAGVADLTLEHAAQVLALEPEVVLLGTGMRQIFPDPSFGFQFLKVGIGIEVMDTGAACRTFNVLIGEQRRVVALLLV